MVAKLGFIVENDGEVAVFIPRRTHGVSGFSFKSYERVCVQLRVNMTPEDFLLLYPVSDEAEEAKVRIVKSLGITEEEYGKAMKKARSDGVECQNLRKLVNACRKESSKQKH